MFASPHALVRVRAARFVKSGVALSFAALLAACSSTRQYSGPQVFSWLQPEPAVPAYAVAAASEVDDEGLPVQSQPSTRFRNLPDDLSQPWRRNSVQQAVPPEAGAAQARVVREDWIAITQNDGFADASIDDEGLPVPKGPEEAGEPATAAPGLYRGSYVAPPSRRCRFGSGWKCGW
jgi:hypothetical protein